MICLVLYSPITLENVMFDFICMALPSCEEKDAPGWKAKVRWLAFQYIFSF